MAEQNHHELIESAEQRRCNDDARRAVVDYLRGLGVGKSTADGAWIKVRFALDRYADNGDARNAEQTKIHIDEIARAAKNLVAAIEKAPAAAWDHLAAETARIIHRSQFEADVRIVWDSAQDALGKLKRNGKPVSAKVELVDQLAMIWFRATDKLPSASGEGSLDAPRSEFGRFVKVVVTTLRAAGFEKGFADLIVGAARRYKKRNPHRVAKPSQKI